MQKVWGPFLHGKSNNGKTQKKEKYQKAKYERVEHKCPYIGAEQYY